MDIIQIILQVSLFKNYKKLKNNRVLVLGCGGVAKAILQSLNDLSFEKVYVSTRNKKDLLLQN